MIRLRFVHCPDVIGTAILLQTGGRFSHVEAVTPQGLYLGAHLLGGVLPRTPDYDTGVWARQVFVDLPADDVMTAAFYHYLNAVIGEPYDLLAIAGFAMHGDFHSRHHTICSALQALALRGCGWLATPLAVPAHEISPRDLLLIISGRLPIPAEETP